MAVVTFLVSSAKKCFVSFCLVFRKALVLQAESAQYESLNVKLKFIDRHIVMETSTHFDPKFLHLQTSFASEMWNETKWTKS